MFPLGRTVREDCGREQIDPSILIPLVTYLDLFLGGWLCGLLHQQCLL